LRKRSSCESFRFYSAVCSPHVSEAPNSPTVVNYVGVTNTRSRGGGEREPLKDIEGVGETNGLHKKRVCTIIETVVRGRM